MSIPMSFSAHLAILPMARQFLTIYLTPCEVTTWTG
jgi:hypothetical protein